MNKIEKIRIFCNYQNKSSIGVLKVQINRLFWRIFSTRNYFKLSNNPQRFNFLLKISNWYRIKLQKLKSWLVNFRLFLKFQKLKSWLVNFRLFLKLQKLKSWLMNFRLFLKLQKLKSWLVNFRLFLKLQKLKSWLVNFRLLKFAYLGAIFSSRIILIFGKF